MPDPMEARVAVLEKCIENVDKALEQGHQNFNTLFGKIDEIQIELTRMNGTLPGIEKSFTQLRESLPKPETCMANTTDIALHKQALGSLRWILGIIAIVCGGGILTLVIRFVVFGGS